MNTKLQVSDKKVSAAWGLYWTKYIGAGDNTQSTRTPGTKSTGFSHHLNTIHRGVKRTASSVWQRFYNNNNNSYISIAQSLPHWIIISRYCTPEAWGFNWLATKHKLGVPALCQKYRVPYHRQPSYQACSSNLVCHWGLYLHPLWGLYPGCFRLAPAPSRSRDGEAASSRSES